MATVVVGAATEKICEMAIEMAVLKLAQEVNLIVNFRKDFRWLKGELRSVRALLQDADQQSRHNDDVKQWLENIRDIAMRAEDISEECAVESMYASSSRQLFFRYKIGRQIRDIKVSMRKITEKAEQLSLRRAVLAADEVLPGTSQAAPVDLKRSNLLPRDSHPVGIQSKVDHILNLLNDPAIPVIAVVGMGGVGKTYLLQHVFNNAKERYEISIWLSVSQSYSVSKLQKDIVFLLKDEAFSERIYKNRDISEQALAQEIFVKLQGKRCLVVLDDVWRASREEDFLTKLGLPSGDNGQCKIVVTTRSKFVSSILKARTYEMECMSDEDSWGLFCVYAFGRMKIVGQLQKEVGSKIVKQCGNLPLAISTIAASLANMSDLSEWEKMLRQLEQANVSADQNYESIMAILKLSYDSLPTTRLKACFAYISFFAEDEKIDAEYLINLWIGEGFMGGAGEDQFDEAWECLHQLANLCLLQLWEEKNADHLPVKQCRVHDLLLDLAIEISRENRCAFSDEEACAITSDGTACSRILLAKKEIDVDAIFSERRPVCLRTFSLSQNRSIESIPEKLFSGMRGLRVLDLSDTNISGLPASVGKMKLLKVLNLRLTGIVEVPECVKHLKSLLFLALPGGCCALPVWISNLKCLQHLVCEGVNWMPKELSKVASLRTLRSRHLLMLMMSNAMMGFDDLGKMTELQELHLQVNNEYEFKRMEEVLAKLGKMRRLFLYSYDSIFRAKLSEGEEYNNKIKANKPNIIISVKKGLFRN